MPYYYPDQENNPKLAILCVGTKAQAEAEYERFLGCFGQLLDDNTMIGDVEGRWVIFQHGWVAGMATYASSDDALAFARQMFRDEPNASYIIVRVDAEEHQIDGLQMLASCVGDADDFDLSTTPDENGRLDDSEIE